MDRKRVEDYDADDGCWVCPDCGHQNDMGTWPGFEECDKCGSEHEFETDYIDASEGIIARWYVGPYNSKEKN